jgi:hypothetical protein
MKGKRRHFGVGTAGMGQQVNARMIVVTIKAIQNEKREGFRKVTHCT